MSIVLTVIIVMVALSLSSQVFGAGTSIEVPRLRLDPRGVGAQVNLSTGNVCRLTKQCGDRCILNRIQPDVPEMPDELKRLAYAEVIAAGRACRHATFCEKEPFDRPALVRHALELYHSRPADARPQAIGAITSAVAIKPHLDWLRETPLDWVLVSLDGLPSTHLRGLKLWEPAFENLLALRARGGSRTVGVNTVVTMENLESVIELGRILNSEGIDYWGLGAFMEPDSSGRVVSTLDGASTRVAIDRLAEAFAGARMPMVFEIEPEQFETISGIDPWGESTPPTWRIEHEIRGTLLRIATINPRPGLWFRLRFDGEVLDKSDLFTVGVVEGRYGRYAPGKLARLLSAAAEQQLQLMSPMHV